MLQVDSESSVHITSLLRANFTNGKRTSVLREHAIADLEEMAEVET